MTITTELRGVKFRPKAAKDIVRTLDESSTLRLERDAENPYDRNAIRVIDVDSDEFIGFVAKEDAVDLAPRMDADETFAVTYHTRSGDLDVMLEITEADEDKSDGGGLLPGVEKMLSEGDDGSDDFDE